MRTILELIRTFDREALSQADPENRRFALEAFAMGAVIAINEIFDSKTNGDLQRFREEAYLLTQQCRITDVVDLLKQTADPGDLRNPNNRDNVQ